jgi:hypothetical protein
VDRRGLFRLRRDARGIQQQDAITVAAHVRMGIERAAMSRRDALQVALQAQLDSQESKRRAAQSAFNEPFWPIVRALVWITFRDPLLVNEPITRGWYDHPSGKSRRLEELRDRYGDVIGYPQKVIANPRSTVLLALQAGRATGSS